MQIRTVRILTSLSLSAVLAACGGATPEATQPTAATTPAASAPTAEAPASTAEASKPATGGDKPMTISLTDTPADKLGTVPAGLALKVGSKAPDGTLLDVSGQPQKLSALTKGSPTFVVFYRGGWCPFCNVQMHALSDAKADFEAKGIKVVAISVDKPDEEAKTKAKNGVPFPMLSDSDLAMHKAFNVVHAAPEAEQKALTGFGVSLTSYSGKTHNSFAVPSIFLIDKAGVIQWVHVDEDYKTRPSPKQMLEVAAKTLKK